MAPLHLRRSGSRLATVAYVMKHCRSRGIGGVAQETDTCTSLGRWRSLTTRRRDLRCVARDPARRRHAGAGDDDAMTEGCALPRRLTFGQAWPVHRPCSRRPIAATAASVGDAWRTRRGVRVQSSSASGRDAARPWEARMTRSEASPPIWAMRCLRMQKSCLVGHLIRGEGERGALGDMSLAPRGHASALDPVRTDRSVAPGA